MKIVYCLNSINYIGGIENVAVTKANALAEIVDNEVFVIVSDHKEAVGFANRLYNSVHLINLGVNYYADDWKSQWYVLKGIFIKRRLHKKRLAKTLYEIQPDVVISVGQAEKYMLPEIKGDWVKIREMHFRKDFRLLSARTFLDKIAAIFSNIYDYCYKIKQYDHIVTLTCEDKERNWMDYKNISVIPNILTFERTENNILNNKKVIAVGRLDTPKNYESLIRAFRIVADCHSDWVLTIYGDGNRRVALQKQIEDMQLENNVQLCGNTSQVQEKMLESSCFVLSSRFEGLPLVMLEAMSCGLPVVSYECPCGPKDIVTDGIDGFLVPTGDEQMLAEKICYLIENPNIRTQMGAAALKKSENYHIEKIIPMWMNLFERLIAEKRNKC